MLGVRNEAGTKCLCFFLSLFTGAPLASLSSFSSLLSSSPHSLLMSSIFFIHLLHLLPPSLPSSSTEGLFLNMSATEAKFGRTSETNLTRHLVVYLSVLRGFFLLLFRQFTFCIGLFKPLFVRCNTSSY